MNDSDVVAVVYFDNETISDNEDFTSSMEFYGVKVFFFLCYAAIFLIGCTSNIIMLVVGIRQEIDDLKFVPNARYGKDAGERLAFSVTNVLVTNLAAADILLCAFSLFFTPISFYFESWPFGEIGCKILPSSSILSVCVISFTSTTIAVDRLLAVCYPHKPRLTVRSALVCLVLLWFLSSICSSPVAYYSTVVRYPDDEFQLDKCAEKWLSGTHQRVFSFGLLFIQFALPAIIISCCYVSIGISLKHRDTHISTMIVRLRREQSRVSNWSNVSFADDPKTVRTIRILVAMVIIYMFCWFPINVLLIMYDYAEENLWHSAWYPPSFFASHVVAMSSTLWNPLLYGWMNGKLRLKMMETVLPGRYRHSIRGPLRAITDQNRQVVERLLSNSFPANVNYSNSSFFNSRQFSQDRVQTPSSLYLVERESSPIVTSRFYSSTDVHRSDQGSQTTITFLSSFSRLSQPDSAPIAINESLDDVI